MNRGLTDGYAVCVGVGPGHDHVVFGGGFARVLDLQRRVHGSCYSIRAGFANGQVQQGRCRMLVEMRCEPVGPTVGGRSFQTSGRQTDDVGSWMSSGDVVGRDCFHVRHVTRSSIELRCRTSTGNVH